MIYRIRDIARDVRIAIDENSDGEQLIAEADIDTLSLEEIVRSKICEAVRRVHTQAPAHLLERGHLIRGAVYWGDRLNGTVYLPDDFMRLIDFQMSDWERPVYTAISADDNEYQMQHSRYGGIRGNVQKPVVAIVSRPEGLALEFWSCASEDAYIERGGYIPYPDIDGRDCIDISERCYDAVVYLTAALALMTYGEVDKSKAMTELCNTLIQ